MNLDQWLRAMGKAAESSHPHAAKPAPIPSELAPYVFGVYLVVFGLTVLITAFTLGQILVRAGFSRWWSLVALIPGGLFIGTLTFAFVPWPAQNKPKRRSSKARVARAA